MAVHVSSRAKALKPSPTLAVATKAKQMVAEGIDVINFGVGEPDFDTPTYIRDAAKQAIDEGYTRYTPVPGIPELRKAICEKLKRDNNVDYKPENIVVSPGAKASIFNVLFAICDKGDKVVVPTPYWVSYPAQISLAQAEAIYVEGSEENGFKVQVEDLKKVFEEQEIRALILNSPSNPTGAVYNESEIRDIAQLCLEYGVLIISDEIYERLIYGNKTHFCPASISDEIKDITIIVNGVSKAYAMTGWRLGYLAGPVEIISQVSKLQGHMTSSVNAMTQKATVTALLEEDDSIENMRKEFEERREVLVRSLNNINQISCTMPDGAFYAMPNVSFYLENNSKGIQNTVELCSYLLENYHIALVPGVAFGAENLVRFSYANSVENIQKGVQRFQNGLYSLI